MIDDRTQIKLYRQAIERLISPRPAISKKRLIRRMTEAAENNLYGMIAFYLPEDIGRQLQIRGGESPEEMHLTLMFLGEVSKLDNPDMIKGQMAEFAKRTRPLSGVINGVGRFIQTHKEATHAVYVSPDLKDLPKVRHKVIEIVEICNVQNPSDHGFVPHITMAYISEAAKTPAILSHVIPVTFNKLSVVLGDERTDYQLLGQDESGPGAPLYER